MNNCKKCGQIQGKIHTCPKINPAIYLGEYAKRGNKLSYWKEKKIPEEIRMKMSIKSKLIGKGKHFKGKPKSEEHKKKLSLIASARIGKLASNWRGGISTDYHTYNAKRRTRRLNADGSYSANEWFSLKERYRYTCPSCLRKEPEIKLTPDHIIPLVKGGSNFITNIQPLCKSCNSRKHTDETKFNFNFI